MANDLIQRIRVAASFLIVFAACATQAVAQETPRQTNFGTWSGYEGYHPFVEGQPWGLMLEGYIKRNNGFADPQAYFFRVGLNYELKSGHRISGGYAIQYNYPYDAASLPYKWTDHRIWEQFIWRHPFGKERRSQLIQRFRVEQRWLARKTPPDLDTITERKFEDTFRYLFRANLSLRKRVSLAIYDELHLRLPPPEAERLLDQNRAYVGLMFYLDEQRLWRLEVGYMNQSFWRSAETEEGRERVNHTLRLTITSDAPLKRN